MIYLILALATWRISSLLVNEDGPWNVFVRLRALVGVGYNSETLQRESKNVVACAFSCVWCMSVWIGLGWTLAFWLWPQTAGWVALPLAFSAVAIGINEYVGD